MSGPTVVDLVTDWGFDPAAAIVIGTTGGLYAVGVRRRPGWSRWRSAAMGGALVAATVATQSGVGRYEGERFTVHMLQHLLLGMVVPLLVVLSAPLTLALQTARPGTRRLLRRSLRSRTAHALTRPLVGWGLFGGGLAVLYLTPLLDVAARHDLVHVGIHAHVVGSGLLFLAVLVGIDALPGRMPPPARLLALLAAVPFHAFVAVAMLSSRSPIDPQTYPSMADQRSAAGIFWGAGEIFTLVAAAIVVRQWWTSEQRAMSRELRTAPAS